MLIMAENLNRLRIWRAHRRRLKLALFIEILRLKKTLLPINTIVGLKLVEICLILSSKRDVIDVAKGKGHINCLPC